MAEMIETRGAAMNDAAIAIKAQNPDLETAWRTIAWWEQTCDYWRRRALDASTEATR